MKKIISLFMACLLVFSCLAFSSCGGDVDPVSDDDPTGESGEAVTINVYNWGEYIDPEVE